MLHWYSNLPENTRISLVGILAIFLVGLVELRSSLRDSADIDIRQAETTTFDRTDQLAPLVDPKLDQALFEQATDSITKVDPLFETLMRGGAFGTLKNRLLNLAADAVNTDQPEELANILLLLGQVSIEQQNLSAAEVYLFEALDVLDSNANEQLKAGIYMQLGRTYLKSRQIARNAGNAYDALQIGRTQFSQGRIALAEANIRYAIEHSLSINRYNAAASGYETLAKLYQSIGNKYESEEAQLNAIRLYSSSGQTAESLSILEQLKSVGVEQWRLLNIEEQVAENQQSYEQSITQIGTAKDYQRLYNYYLHQGDKRRAWHFRLLASQSLEEVSKRAMFHRQQGVLALLYNSNDAMTKAKHYFANASERFEAEHNQDRAEETHLLSKQVY